MPRDRQRKPSLNLTDQGYSERCDRTEPRCRCRGSAFVARKTCGCRASTRPQRPLYALAFLPFRRHRSPCGPSASLPGASPRLCSSGAPRHWEGRAVPSRASNGPPFGCARPEGKSRDQNGENTLTPLFFVGFWIRFCLTHSSHPLYVPSPARELSRRVFLRGSLGPAFGVGPVHAEIITHSD